jgi:hypothetical protein
MGEWILINASDNQRKQTKSFHARHAIHDENFQQDEGIQEDPMKKSSIEKGSRIHCDLNVRISSTPDAIFNFRCLLCLGFTTIGEWISYGILGGMDLPNFNQIWPASSLGNVNQIISFLSFLSFADKRS